MAHHSLALGLRKNYSVQASRATSISGPYIAQNTRKSAFRSLPLAGGRTNCLADLFLHYPGRPFL